MNRLLLEGSLEIKQLRLKYRFTLSLLFILDQCYHLSDVACIRLFFNSSTSPYLSAVHAYLLISPAQSLINN